MKAYPGNTEPGKAAEPDLTGTYTAADYITWTFEGMVELVRGKIFKMSPAPATNHQRIIGFLHYEFEAAMKGHPCQVWLSPVDVYLVPEGVDYRQAENVFQPDLLIVCDHKKVKTFGIVGAPDFVIEVLSPSNAKKDRVLKKAEYEDYGVKEYWIVDSKKRQVLINILKDGKYNTLAPVTKGQVIQPQEFRQVKIKVEEMFKGLLEE